MSSVIDDVVGNTGRSHGEGDFDRCLPVAEGGLRRSFSGIGEGDADRATCVCLKYGIVAIKGDRAHGFVDDCKSC